MKKLSIKAVVSVICSAVLFCMPIGAYLANSSNAITVFANADETTEAIATLGDVSGNDAEEQSDEAADTDEQETEDTLVCTCDSTCSQYGVDTDCEVCAANYKDCQYVSPNVTITIKTLKEWYKTSANVYVDATDTLSTGNFVVAKMEARIGQNGSWTDITDDRYIEISENCSIYVRITDQKGNTYEKNRAMRCFDTTKPTLNAAVSEGVLTIQASDTDSGVKSVYINGYEFTELNNGVLNVRLQQFDSGYQYFTIQALDNAGNMSETYKTQNPYYNDPDSEDDDDASSSLPASAAATAPSSATGNVTEHSITNSTGNVTSTTKESSVDSTPSSSSDSSAKGEDSDESQYGKEFYTIETASEKVFYLIIDRDGEEEVVYFLTEISENDLLNTVDTTSETLPKNSAALNNGNPTESALPNNNLELEDGEVPTEGDALEDSADEALGETDEAETEEEQAPIQESTMGTYILFGAIGAVVLVAAYFLKIKKKKDDDYMDEEDDPDVEEEEMINEDEEAEEDEDSEDEDEVEESNNPNEDDTETQDDSDETDPENEPAESAEEESEPASGFEIFTKNVNEGRKDPEEEQ